MKIFAICICEMISRHS